jgi:hypothetical protein
MDVVPDMEWMNSKEIGNALPTKHRIVSRKLDAKYKIKAFPNIVALFASQCMCKCTTAVVGATTAYSHKIEIDPTVVELPKRTIVEYDGNAQFNYPDIACVGFTISGKRNDFVDFEADLVGSGAESTGDATAEPAESIESYHVYSDCAFSKGGAIAGGVYSGGTSVNSDLVDFKLTFKNGGKGVHQIGDTSGNFTSIRRGEAWTVDFEANVEIEDQNYHTDLFAGNENVMHIPIVGGVANGTAHYGIDILLPRTSYRAAAKKIDAGIVGVNIKCAVLLDPTYGGLIITCTNLHTKSYLATA